MASGNGGTSSQADRLGEILGAYFVAVEEGRAPSRQELLAQHPDLASELVEYFAEQDRLDRMVAPMRSPGSPVSTVIDDPTLDLANVPHVLLRDTEPGSDGDPLIQPLSPEMPALADRPARLQLFGEIARGGMGAILKGRDVDMGRELAVKVLLESNQGHPQIVRRFIEEAQIGGQLQHPGIVPVYELGAFADRRPYFAMKLVKGRTLAEMLAARRLSGPPHKPEAPAKVPAEDPPHKPEAPAKVPAEDPSLALQACEVRAADLPRFLSIFEQVCQTMAYAHARGVIHRDLKPSNVMVGAFGEVQVMDWGLAKVLPRGDAADRTPEDFHETDVITVRSGSGTDASRAGSILGTPSYMAPEQARGELDQVDERADVFGLGAILCEILTGKPPFGGETRDEVRQNAAQGDMAAAFNRLSSCSVESDLTALARDCLAADRQQRPRNAGIVSARITAYLSGVQDRLRKAELARVEAQARAEEERKRRRITVALAASVLLTAGVVGGGWAYLARQRTGRLLATTRVVSEALAEALRLSGQAEESAAGDLTKWSDALGAARRARGLLNEGEADDALQDRVAVVLAGLEREWHAAEQRAAEVERDRKLLGELETIRGNRSEHWDSKRTDVEYAAAFRGFGIDLDQLGPEEAGKRIAQRSEPVELASYLDDWSRIRRAGRGTKDEASWRRLLAAAQAADPDPWRATLRDQIGRNDRGALRRLAADQKTLEAQPASSLVLFASALTDQGDRDRAARALRQLWQREPGDFWVNFELGLAQWSGFNYARSEEAARFYSAAVAIRPRSYVAHSNLGNALLDQGKLDEAIAEYRTALRLKPDYAEAHNNLGNALHDQGKLDEAIAEYRTALRLKPDFAGAHSNLSNSLCDQGKLDEAITECRTALRLKPDLPHAHNNLGKALLDQGKLDEAIAEYRTALRLKPDYALAHSGLGGALDLQGKLDEAIAECRAALRLKPDLAEAHGNLGNALYHQGKLDEAIAEYRTALRLKPDLAGAHSNLGNFLCDQGKLDEAIAEYRTALRLKPDYALAHSGLGLALYLQGKLEEAVTELREAVLLKPDFLEAHGNLGSALYQQGKLNEAIAELRKARDLAAANTQVRQRIEQVLAVTEHQAALTARLPAVLRGEDQPKNAPERFEFGLLCYNLKRFSASARLFAEAFQADPKLAEDMQAQNRYNAACAVAQAGCGQGKDEPPLDEAARARWRKQAIDWLKADMGFWTRQVETGPQQVREAVAKALQHWKVDTDLAGIREESTLAKLPEDERKACRALWAEVEVLLKKAQSP